MGASHEPIPDLPSKETSLVWSFKTVIVNAFALAFVMMVMLNTSERDPFSTGVVLVNKDPDCSDVSQPVICTSVWDCARKTCNLSQGGVAYTTIQLLEPSRCRVAYHNRSFVQLEWSDMFFVIATSLSIVHCLLLVVHEFSWLFTGVQLPLHEPTRGYGSESVASQVTKYLVVLLLLLTRMALLVAFVLAYSTNTQTPRGTEMVYVVILTSGAFMIDLAFDVCLIATKA